MHCSSKRRNFRLVLLYICPLTVNFLDVECFDFRFLKMALMFDVRPTCIYHHLC
jgi:hypothetical protein